MAMTKREDTLNKTYGNIPKEVGFGDIFDWLPTYRGIKYYWYKLIRKATR
jgi:hypothetical protein